MPADPRPPGVPRTPRAIPPDLYRLLVEHAEAYEAWLAGGGTDEVRFNRATAALHGYARTHLTPEKP
jgi:hypothetical protein